MGTSCGGGLNENYLQIIINPSTGVDDFSVKLDRWGRGLKWGERVMANSEAVLKNPLFGGLGAVFPRKLVECGVG